jgi:hypothetical protein
MTLTMTAPTIPEPLPAAIVRPRGQIAAVMAQSLREQGGAGHTADAWRWALTGHGPSPVRRTPGTGVPPAREVIAAEARHDPFDDPPGYLRLDGPPWVSDHNPGRKAARRVLMWLAGIHDMIPLTDPNRGRYVGARLFFARTDAEIRRVRGYAFDRMLADPVPEHITDRQAAHPWTMDAGQMEVFYLHGVFFFLLWVTGDDPDGPLTGKPSRESPPGILDLDEELATLNSVVMQGREYGWPAEPDLYPPPQYGEGIDAAAHWLTGEDTDPPVDHHGCGAYTPCPGDRRCTCEAAGHCLHGRCVACASKPCSL